MLLSLTNSVVVIARWSSQLVFPTGDTEIVVNNIVSVFIFLLLFVINTFLYCIPIPYNVCGNPVFQPLY